MGLRRHCRRRPLTPWSTVSSSIATTLDFANYGSRMTFATGASFDLSVVTSRQTSWRCTSDASVTLRHSGRNRVGEIGLAALAGNTDGTGEDRIHMRLRGNVVKLRLSLAGARLFSNHPGLDRDRVWPLSLRDRRDRGAGRQPGRGRVVDAV